MSFGIVKKNIGLFHVLVLSLQYSVIGDVVDVHGTSLIGLQIPLSAGDWDEGHELSLSPFEN
eukprot:205751-Karenia_brevis.AAC.1